ncbi:TRNA pseudouridine synthase A, mitochondrial [Aphelenchoides bicaudatus]|nr:TRNA pseudouridine synthase A, mitochondrial [Aphelenchoides bicaudatus]
MSSTRVCNALIKQNGILPSVQIHFSNIFGAAASKQRALPKGYRPPNPFALLVKEVASTGLKVTEAGKAAAAKWKSLSPEKLQAYRDEAEKIGKERKKQFELLSKDEKERAYAKQDADKKIRKIRAGLLETSKVSSFFSLIMSSINKGASSPATQEVAAAALAKRRTWRYAVFLCYQGKNYFGMQIQKEYPTIEGHLLTALRLFGIIDEKQEKDPYSFFFQRAARTDRSVSAVRQVCSMHLPKDDNFMNNGPEQLNSFLPKDIRVVSIRRVTPTFHAQKSCDSRTYSYTLPTFAFAEIDKLTNSDYRITPERIAEIDTCLKYYVGTHNFFNYTSRKEHADQSCHRYILSFKCGEPFIYRDTFRNKDVEFMTIYIRGQSFMMHQIRKMIGMVIAVTRGLLYRTDVQKSFESKRMDVPKAPGLGLLLERLHYESYDKKFGKSHASMENLGEEVENRILQIRDELIVNEILSTECTTQSMMNWLSTLGNHNFATDPEATAKPSFHCFSSNCFIRSKSSLAESKKYKYLIIQKVHTYHEQHLCR